MIMAKVQRFTKIRHLHTIIYQETIKPSSPTPSHLKIHNLSIIDHSTPHIHMPFVYFYKNYKHSDINTLKKSLSQCLTQYYPFAGRFVSPSARHIDCNDQGVDFLEASIDDRLDNFISKKEQNKTLEQLVPNGLGCSVEKTSHNMMEVQLNHFTCGGAAVAVSISHKIADGFTMLNLCNHWATVTRGGSPTNPRFVNPPTTNFRILEYKIRETCNAKYLERKFVFPNSKLNELKKKISAMSTRTTTLVNPTRVESLTSLIFKCAVDAATTKSGSLQPSNLCQGVNFRNKFDKDLYKPVAGNLSAMVIATMANSGEFELDQVITNLRKEMLVLDGVRDVEEALKNLGKSISYYGNGRRLYLFTSTCNFPFYEVDFGWGKPERVMILAGYPGNNVLLMDTPYGDGIEASVQLKEEEMAIFRKNKELLAYTGEFESLHLSGL